MTYLEFIDKHFVDIGFFAIVGLLIICSAVGYVADYFRRRK